MDDATLHEAGELEALRRFLPLLPAGDATAIGPGDDAAVVAAPDGRFVVTTDTMLEGADFRLGWSRWHDLGWKAVATNLIDVAAMGARPTSLVVALAVPPSTRVAALEELAHGLADAIAAMAPGVGVVGGDLGTARHGVIAVTAFGDLEGRAPVLRSGARAGDAVWLVGALGLAATGLRHLFVEAVDEAAEPDRDAAERLRRGPHGASIAAQLAPVTPIGAGTLLADLGATAMLDVSDGLALDAARVARASGVRIALDGRGRRPRGTRRDARGGAPRRRGPRAARDAPRARRAAGRARGPPGAAHRRRRRGGGRPRRHARRRAARAARLGPVPRGLTPGAAIEPARRRARAS